MKFLTEIPKGLRELLIDKLSLCRWSTLFFSALVLVCKNMLSKPDMNLD